MNLAVCSIMGTVTTLPSALRNGRGWVAAGGKGLIQAPLK